jgi:lipoprotein-anchoring transpeptidase ErfK/SrfK
VQEALAEKFHMSEKLLRELNPNATFESAGTEIVVPNAQREELPRKIARVEVRASEQRVGAYDKDHNVVAVYPATVGKQRTSFAARGAQSHRDSRVPAVSLRPGLEFEGGGYAEEA